MYPSKILLIITIIIFILSGYNGFLIQEGFLKINQSYLSLFLDVVLSIITIFSINKTKQVKKLILYFLIFLLTTILSFIINFNELTTIVYFNGLREFLPYFLFPIIFINIFQSYNKELLVKYFDIFLHVFLILQIPVSLYQFSINGAGDMVGGTQGEGYSGILTFIIFLSTYYLIIKRFDENNIFRSFIRKSYLLIYWIPAFINETKISFIFIALFFLLLVKISASNIHKYIYIIIILIPSIFVFNTIYQNVTSEFDSNEFLSDDFVDAYLLSDNDENTDITRFGKLTILMNDFNKHELIFGKGIGQFKGGTTLALTPFASKYEWLLSGSVPTLFFLLVQVGIIGALIFIFYWIRLINLYRIKRRTNYSLNLITFTTICFIIIQFYNDSLRSLFFSGIIMYFTCYAVYECKKQI